MCGYPTTPLCSTLPAALHARAFHPVSLLRPAPTSLASPLISPVLLFSTPGRRPAGANKSKTPPKSRPELSSRESLAESPKTRETRGKLKCMVRRGPRGGEFYIYIYKGKIGRVTRSRNRVDKIHARSIKYLNYGEESACNQLCIPAIPPT